MSINDMMKRVLAGETPTDSLGLGSKLLAGSVAATTAQTIVFPLDTLRRRLQVRGLTNSPTTAMIVMEIALVQYCAKCFDTLMTDRRTEKVVRTGSIAGSWTASARRIDLKVCADFI